jgi:hypothetical protein
MSSIDEKVEAPVVERPEAAEAVRTIDDVRHEIEETRAELELSTEALREKLALGRRLGDWARAHPEVTIAGAFVFGFLLGFRR